MGCIVFPMLPFLRRSAVALHDTYFHVKSLGVDSELAWGKQTVYV